MLLAYGNYFKFKFFIQRYIVKQMLEIYIIIEKNPKTFAIYAEVEVLGAPFIVHT